MGVCAVLVRQGDLGWGECWRRSVDLCPWVQWRAAGHRSGNWDCLEQGTTLLVLVLHHYYYSLQEPAAMQRSSRCTLMPHSLTPPSGNGFEQFQSIYTLRKW